MPRKPEPKAQSRPTRKYPRVVLGVPGDVYDRLIEEQERVRKSEGMHVSIASLLRKAITNTYGED